MANIVKHLKIVLLWHFRPMHCNVFSSNKDSPTKSIEKSLFYVRRSKYKLSKKSFESRVEFIHFLRFATCHFFSCPNFSTNAKFC